MRHVAGAGLLHPLPLGAMLVMALNDHWWKQAHPGFLTGKLSDVAGMIFFPLFLQALFENAQAAAGREWQPSRRLLLGCAIASAAVLAAIKLSPAAGALYTHAWGVLQWPLRAIESLLRGRELPGVLPVALVQDPTDVLTTPFAFLALLPRRRERVREGEEASHAIA